MYFMYLRNTKFLKFCFLVSKKKSNSISSGNLTIKKKIIYIDAMYNIYITQFIFLLIRMSLL